MTNSQIALNPALGTRRLLTTNGGTNDQAIEPPKRHDWHASRRDGDPRCGTCQGKVAATVLWLCSLGASFVIGHALAVDGTVTLMGNLQAK
jgi:hypothetical protein